MESLDLPLRRHGGSLETLSCLLGLPWRADPTAVVAIARWRVLRWLVRVGAGTASRRVCWPRPVLRVRQRRQLVGCATRTCDGVIDESIHHYLRLPQRSCHPVRSSHPARSEPVAGGLGLWWRPPLARAAQSMELLSYDVAPAVPAAPPGGEGALDEAWGWRPLAGAPCARDEKGEATGRRQRVLETLSV